MTLEIELLPLARYRDESDHERLAELVREQYTRYVAFHSDYAAAEADLLTLWTLHTWVFGAAEVTPYLLITAPTPEAGKSRILDVTRQLVAHPEWVVEPSAASLFRLIDQGSPTLLIDEVDELQSNKAVRAVLKSGHFFGGSVPRVESIDGIRMTVKYNTFCPKAFAGIAGRKPPLQGAALSRCVEIPMRRRTDDEPVERFKIRDARIACDPLRQALALWGGEQVERLRKASPKLPDLGDRQVDHWEPLCAIAELLGRSWPDRAMAAANALAGRATRQADGTQILAEVKAVWDEVDGDRIHTVRLATARDGLEDRRYEAGLSGHELSQWLGRFDIRPLPNPFRHEGKLRRGYERRAFADAFERYL
jgi:hypothetical protein